MKHSVREAVARSHTGWDYAQADRVIAWLDQCGYAIADKKALRGVSTLAAQVTIAPAFSGCGADDGR
jgi:hypothetical protein